jgi:hypothetical protein
MDKKNQEEFNEKKTLRKGKKDMLTVKELIRNNTDRERENLSPLDIALDRFEKENGYSFKEMIENSRIRKKHKLKQMQKPNYDDDDFLKIYENEQGE